MTTTSSPAPIRYDPMIFDILDEAATYLRGCYMARWHASNDPNERARFTQLQLAVLDEFHEVDERDVDAVRAKTAEFIERAHAFESRGL